MPNNLYFDTPFATSGDTTTVPDGTQSDGSVSYTQGYGVAYSTAVASGGYNFPRAQHNQVLKDVTTALQLMQQNGCFSFITTDMNGGVSPYSYNLGALVLYDISDGNGPQVWRSTSKANTTTPGAGGAKWVSLGKPTLYTGGTSGGTANAQTVTTNYGSFTNTAGNIVTWIAGNSVTGASTLNPDASSAVPLKVMTPSGVRDTQYGDIVTNGVYMGISDGTNLQLLNPSSESTRQQLVANTTFYVSTSGSDTTGIGTVGAPWQTLNHAISYLASSIDLAGFAATIQLADGTGYSGSITSQFVGRGSVVINGNAVTPSNVALSLYVAQGAVVSIANCKLTNGSGNGLNADQGGIIYGNAGLVFGTCSGAQIAATNGGRFFPLNSYSVSGNAAEHMLLSDHGEVNVVNSSTTATITTPVTFTNTVLCNGVSVADLANLSFTGSAVTGTKYSINSNSVVFNTAGLPGSVSGSTATGGQAL